MRSRRRTAVALSVAAITALAGLGVSATAATSGSTSGGLLQIVRPRTTFHASQSSNWFGYQQSVVKTKKPFTQVSGTWIVPTASQHVAGRAEHSSAWIGVGGGCLTQNCLVTDSTLIQAGTESDVNADGTRSYHAWWEIIPAPSLNIDMAVHPGDKIYSQIKTTLLTPEVWKIVLENRTTGAKFSTTVPYSSTFGTAEWIVETPIVIGTGGTGFATLPNLTNTHFDNATANGQNPHFGVGQQIELINGNGNVIGRSSKPQGDGNGFNACAWTTSCPVPANF